MGAGAELLVLGLVRGCDTGSMAMGAPAMGARVCRAGWLRLCLVHTWKGGCAHAALCVHPWSGTVVPGCICPVHTRARVGTCAAHGHGGMGAHVCASPGAWVHMDVHVCVLDVHTHVCVCLPVDMCLGARWAWIHSSSRHWGAA